MGFISDRLLKYIFFYIYPIFLIYISLYIITTVLLIASLVKQIISDRRSTSISVCLKANRNRSEHDVILNECVKGRFYFIWWHFN